MLLGASLALGVYWTFEFYRASSEPGVPVGDFGGLVVDANDSPVPGATVTVEGLGASATTDANGSFLLHGVPSGRLTLVVERQGFVTTRFTVFAAPSEPGTPLVHAEFLRIEAGSGTRSEDLATTRDWWLTVCMSTFLIGNVLNGVGLVATIGRRRYRHAMLGPVGAIISFGALFGMVFAIIAMFLLMGARDEFEDRGSLFATEHDMPFPRGESSADESAGESADGAAGETADGAAGEKADEAAGGAADGAAVEPGKDDDAPPGAEGGHDAAGGKP